jgi:type VI secretion system secreted protein VgrG
MPLKQSTRHVAVSTPLGDDILVLHRMTATEQLGRLFQFNLELLSEDGNLAIDDMLGQNVTVSLDTQTDEPRLFNGFVSRFSQGDPRGRLAVYHATLRPWLWFLTRTADCRIYQEMKVPDIIKDVFREHGFSDFEEALSGSYREWEFCVQYRETDFNFVSRLMEQEGIYYFFRHENGKHTLVLADGYNSHAAVPGYEEIPYFPPDQSQRRERDHVFNWLVSHEVRPGKYALDDFDFKTPRKSLLSQAIVNREHAQADFEVFDYPGEYEQSADGDRYATVRIQELQSHHERASATGVARGLCAGALFSLVGYSREDQNREYLVLSVNHEIQSDDFQNSPQKTASVPYLATMEVMDAREPYRPARTTPKPVVQGPQTAIVVGPESEEIHTDEFGRVRVRFHWDRHSADDDKSSVWMRVGQILAGKNFGAVMLPRVGWEVVVEFLEGDADRPIVIGTLYNGDNRPPYELPANKTISTIKTNSSKGGGGFNELRFEDKKGEEQLFVHAERNLDMRVKANRYETVGADRHLVVEDNKWEHVKQERHETVDSHHYEQICGDRHLKVAGKEAKAVDQSLSLTVGGDIHEVCKSDHSEKVDGQYTVKAGVIVLEAASNVTLKVGGSYVAINGSGVKVKGSQVVIDGGNVTVKAQANIKVEAGAIIEVKAGAILKLEGGGMAELKGGGLVQIQGGLVKIN